MSTKKTTDTGGNAATTAIKTEFLHLAERDKVRLSITTDAAQDLIDGVISTGVLAFHAFKIKSPKGPLTEAWLKSANEQLADALIEHHSDETSAMSYESSVQCYTRACVTATAKIIAQEVNAYTDGGGTERKNIAKVLQKMLAALALTRGTKVVSSRAVYNDEDKDDPRHVTVTQFLNPGTRKAIAFYMVEGRM